MAFNPLFEGGYTSKGGVDVRVYVDRDGYSGSVFSLDVHSDRLFVGQNSGGLFAPSRRSRSRTVFLAGGAALDEAKVIPRRPYGSHRVRVEHDGTEVYRGFVSPQDTTTPITGPRDRFAVRAKTGIQALSADWRQSNGDPFSGREELSVILADIFGAIGLARPIDAVLGWRPAGMADASDPLAITADAAAWQRENSEGQLNVASRRDVISDIVGVWGACLFLEDGTWRIRQPTEYVSGSSVTAHEYDAAGAHLGTTTRPATVDIEGDPWERDSDEVSGVTQLQSAAVTFEHGAPGAVYINGSFEQGSGGNPTGWDLPTSDFTLSSTVTASSESTKSLRIQGDAFLPNSASLEDMKDEVNEEATTTVGGYAAGSESVDLTLNYRTTVTPDGGIDGDQPELIRLYWAAKHVTVQGTTYWLVGGSWTKESNLGTLNDRLNGFQAGAFGGSAWQEKTVTIPSPPLAGTLSLELAEPISREQSTEGSAYDYAAYWDDIVLSRSLSEGAAQTLFRASDPEVDAGDSLERTFRIGDGPYEESPGALKTPSGDFTGSWRIVGESETYALHELLAKEIMAALRGGAQLIRSEFREPTRPKARRAVAFDNLSSWPVQVDQSVEDDVYTLALVQLRDEGPPPDFEIVAGGEESFGSAGGGGAVGDDGGASSWGELTGKPSGLFSSSGGEDGISETIPIPAEVSSFKPGAVRASSVVFSHVARHAWSVKSLLIFAGTPPTADYNFDIKIGSTVQTVTLSRNAQSDTYSISAVLSKGERLRVVSEASADSSLADLHCSFDVLPA